jgi:hypothetical protein
MIRAGMDIGKITAAATRYADFFSHFLTVINQQNGFAPSCRDAGRKQSGGTGANYHDIHIHHAIFHNCHDNA